MTSSGLHANSNDQLRNSNYETFYLFNSQKHPPASAAPSGTVTSQDSTISRTRRQSASLRRSRPMPNSPPEVTCVVETGSAKREASTTSVAATRFAPVASGADI